MKLTVLSRSYCSLCQKMLDALAPWQAQYGFEVQTIDVDGDEALVDRYNELVPVLLAGDTEICHWHLDEAKLQAFLASIHFYSEN
ncbi:glutaredoxin family protein [Lautropia dentalis]|uniref:Glutaredoxin family protein n=1 Tax=Lautropia dentalis TaxID=2490857 RepID=A0A3R8LT85_9BURK|nr:glutaredoxin family protein [Lautropia dentalis]RRN45665.1 glutaredoxin family protein [Lautropia dentalis]